MATARRTSTKGTKIGDRSFQQYAKRTAKQQQRRTRRQAGR